MCSGWDQTGDIESLEHDLRWRRADLGDMPERGQIISLVVWSADPRDTTVKIYERMRVEIVFTEPKARILGPGLPFEMIERFEMPERPAEPGFGPEIMLWRERG